MSIALAADHAGFQLKEKVKSLLDSLKLTYLDFGTHSEEAADYPDYGVKGARAVSEGRCQRGIFICGTGIGMSMVANRFRGVRAALCTSVEMAQYSRRHNDANVLVLGGRTTQESEAMEIVKTWLTTDFERGRHLRRVQKIHQLTGL